MVSKIDHIGILVDDITDNRQIFEVLNIDIESIEHVPEFGVEIAFIKAGESLIELVEPVDRNSDLASDLETTAQTALLHHIALRVNDIETRLAELRNADVPLADEMPRQGAGNAKVAFLERQAANGVRIELIERDSEITFE